MNPCEKDLMNRLTTLTVRFDAFKELMDERHKHLDALSFAAKEAVSIALLTTEKAAMETKSAFAEYKQGANEWHLAMTAREAKFASLSDHLALKERVDKMDARFATIPELTALKEQVVTVQGELTALKAAGQGMNKMYGWLVAGALVVLEMVRLFWK